MTGDIGLEVWRGGVNTWECDEMGHMNVRFYVARAMEGIVGLAGALGLEGAFKANAQATLLIKDQHIRFIREARPGAALHMTAGVIEIGESEARFLHLLIHSATGEVAASFQTVVTHATPGDERPFAWSDRTRGLAEGLMTGTPAAVAPRSLIPTAVATRASLAEADSLGLARLGAGAFGPGDCDVFGRMRPEIFIGRVADSVPRMAQIFGGATGAEAPAPPPASAARCWNTAFSTSPGRAPRSVRDSARGWPGSIAAPGGWFTGCLTRPPGTPGEAPRRSPSPSIWKPARSSPWARRRKRGLRERITPGLSL